MLLFINELSIYKEIFDDIVCMGGSIVSSLSAIQLTLFLVPYKKKWKKTNKNLGKNIETLFGLILFHYF